MTGSVSDPGTWPSVVYEEAFENPPGEEMAWTPIQLDGEGGTLDVLRSAPQVPRTDNDLPDGGYRTGS
jgi:hypothetical protein